MQRASGVLLHISSLPSLYNFGSIGKEAYEFVDFLKESGFSYWQILPINPTNESGSPFQSFSVFAGNISLIDLTPYLTKTEQEEYLKCSKNFIIKKEDICSCNTNENVKKTTEVASCEQINFNEVYKTKLAFLKNIFSRDFNKYNLETFKKDNSFWLDDFCVFCCLKDIYKAPYWKFGNGYNKYNKKLVEEFKTTHKKQIDFYCFTQFLFFMQLTNLKEYANSKGIKIFGDVAFYPSGDSCVVLANNNDFCFDEKGSPKGIAGVPPDYFSKDGQLWGSPVYDIENMKKNKYRFWTKRLEHANNFFDIARLDHFRGFESFWVVKNYKSLTAKNGKWVKGLGLEFFNSLKNKNVPNLVAEDLGIITNKVQKLIENLGLAGMEVFQFAFDGNPKNSYFPHNYKENCVAYLGTHDNNTFIGFLEDEVNFETLQQIKNYLGQSENASNTEMLNMAISILLNSRADTVILTMQDILHLNSNYRMNTPGTTHNNWCFRLNSNYDTNQLKQHLLKLNISANRASFLLT